MTNTEQLDLLPDELVEVRGAAEILATLDENGTLEGLPFMPEMLEFCGKRFRVYKRADRTCDTVTSSGMRRMYRTVHLSETRCDGQGHGDCHARCFLFWKEAWLRRVAGDGQPPVEAAAPAAATRDRAWLEATASQSRPGEETRYRCQITELKRASHPLPWWKPGQYYRDIFLNKTPVPRVFLGLISAMINKYRRRMTGHGFPYVGGPMDQTPVEELGLQPGQWVIVKSKAEIMATLDRNGKNRGMSFDGEMFPYCGKRYRVLRRVDRIVDEQSGRLMPMRTPAVILENVICTSLFRRPCPRCIHPYWREIWLRRDPNQSAPDASSDLVILDSRS